MRKKTTYQAEKPLARQNVWQSLWYDSETYTSEELRIREKILILRKHSGIDNQLLETGDPWFSEEVSQAFHIKNENSWFLKTSYTPRSHITRDNFHILLPNHKQSWPKISSLRLQTGDFLLKRTEEHTDSELNEPFHYFYLDLVNIFTRLAQNSDGEYVATQLSMVSQYIQQVSTLITNPKSNDKLFMEHCRVHLREVLKEDITSALDSQQFSNLFIQLQSALEILGEQYHTLLHFALIDTPVNAHPYWEYFIHEEPVEAVDFLPTIAARDCLATHESQSDSEDAFTIKTVLPDCPTVSFGPDVSQKQQELYFKNLKFLQDLLRFKQMLMRIQALTQQAGELFTRHYFRNDLFNLFNQVEQFFLNTHNSMLQLLEENDELHHQSIVALNEMSWWSALWSNRQTRLETYIQNQNNFARFNINPRSLKTHLDRITNLLIRASTQLRTPQLASGKDEYLLNLQNEVQTLFGAMYNWRIEQNIQFELPLPEKPKLLALADNEEQTVKAEKQSSKSFLYHRNSEYQNENSLRKPLSDVNIPSVSSSPPVFFPPERSGLGNLAQPTLYGESSPNNYMLNPLNNNNTNTLPSSTANGTLLLLTGVPFIFVIGLLLYLYFKRPHEEENEELLENSDEEMEPFQYNL